MNLLQRIDVGTVLIQFAVLLFSLSIHEASHAWVSDRCGDGTARFLGRVTLNPMAHIDPVGTLLFPLLQMFTGFPLIGWAKPVPVNAAHLRNPRRDQILVSLAGPASNLTAAAAAFLLLALFRLVWPEANGVVLNMAFSFRVPLQGSAAAPLVGFLFFALVINLALALFNLIPIPPLDGHWVLYELLPPGAARALAGLSSYGILLLYALMILGMFDFIFVPIRRLLDLLVSF